MVIHANTNWCTHLSCNSWEDTTFWCTYHQRQVNVVLGNLVHMHYPDEVTRSNGTTSPATCGDDYALAPDATYITSKGVVWSDFWVSFLIIFFKVLSLTHLTSLLLDFEIAEMIPLAKRRHAISPKECVRKECSQACESIHIKWTDSCIERVLADGRGAATGLVPRWFRYISDWRTICNGKTCWSKFHYLFTLFLLFLMYN
jgi:hypothetical protein